MIIAFKTTAGAVAAIQKHTYKIVCFKDAAGGRLRVDAAATTGGKQDPSKQGLRSILIYKYHVYKAASLYPERCSHKTYQQARNLWVANQLRQFRHNEDFSNPDIHTQEEYMEEDINMGDTDQDNPHAPSTEIPTGGSGVPLTRAPTEGTTAAGTSESGGTTPTGATRLRFGTPEPPALPIRDRGGTHT